MSDVAGFLGDFGIGNSIEYNHAIGAATSRENALYGLKAEKGCGSVAASE